MHDHRRASPAALPSLVILVTVAVDQVTKWLVGRTLGPGRADRRIEILEPVLALEYVENTGAAFGTFRGQGVLLSLLAVLVLSGLVVYYRRMAVPSRLATASLGLLAGGAVGNLLDRFRLGYVVDFVAVGVWPKFNVADSAITVGVALLAWQVLTSDQRAANDRRHSRMNPEPALIVPGDGATRRTDVALPSDPPPTADR